MSLAIYYDGDCPFCTRYVTMLRLRETGEVRLVDLREDPALRAELRSQGFEVNTGMVVEDTSGRVGGADAVNKLALLSTPSTAFNKINRALFSSSFASSTLYPVLRMGRWIALFLMGRNLMDSENAKSESRQTIFTIFFAIFSIFHFSNYAFEYDRFPPSWDMFLILAAALYTLVRPTSDRALFILMLVSTISTITQAPIGSNHTMVRSAVIVGYWLSFIVSVVRNLPAGAVFTNFVPAGQGVLLVMYFYGIFHKINADFLNPITSCAVALWELMPPPMSWFQQDWAHYAAIYGTFIVEGLLIVALLTKRWRHWGIAAGIAFHFMLSFSAYAMYISFTMLSIALHTLFLSESAANNVMNSKALAFLRSRMVDPVYIFASVALVATFAVLAFAGSYTYATFFALPLLIPFCLIILAHGAAKDRTANFGKTGLAIGFATAALFFVNGAMPYLGLKTSQSTNMFANLRLEGGVSNHLVFSGSQRPFRYLDDVAIIEDGGDDNWLKWVSENDFGIVHYDLLARLQENPELTISYRVRDRTFTDVDAQAMKSEIEQTLHAPWVRKWFHFQPVYLGQPEHCNV